MHLKGNFSILNNCIASFREIRYSLPKMPLLSIYNAFLRPHLGHNLRQACKGAFVDSIELIKYKATAFKVLLKEHPILH